jgi:hypothetical protein
MKLVRKFEDLTLKQYIELQELQSSSLSVIDKAVKKLSIITGESIDYIESINVKEVYSLLASVSFVDNPPEEIAVKKRIRLGFMLYEPTLSLTEMKVNQLTDFYHLYDNKAPINEILAVIYKPIKGSYKPANHAKVAKMLLNEKVGNTLGTLFFYSNYWKRCEKTITEYLNKQNQVIQSFMKEIQDDKQFQDFLVTGGGNTI